MRGRRWLCVARRCPDRSARGRKGLRGQWGIWRGAVCGGRFVNLYIYVYKDKKEEEEEGTALMKKV